MRRDEANEEEKLPITVVGASTVPDTSTTEKLNYVVSTLQKQEIIKAAQAIIKESTRDKCGKTPFKMFSLS